jgi:23S rRNA-/tRNA-specific pseudouridylate synthase
VKTYQAIVCGDVPEKWICETPLGANAGDEPLPASTLFERMAVREAGSFAGRPELVLALLKITPTTGRFHQIRRHLLEAGFPVVGDFRYAGIERSHELGEILGTGTRMLLQAKALEMDHPHTGALLKIEAPVDGDFAKSFPGVV